MKKLLIASVITSFCLYSEETPQQKKCAQEYLYGLAQCNSLAAAATLACGNNLSCVREVAHGFMQECQNVENGKYYRCYNSIAE